MLAIFFNTAFYSCSPESISDANNTEQLTGGGDGEILPPDPPGEGG